MVLPRHASETVWRVDGNDFRGGEAFSGRKRPGEVVGVYTDESACESLGALFDFDEMGAGVDQGETIGVAVVLGSRRLDEGNKWVVKV